MKLKKCKSCGLFEETKTNFCLSCTFDNQNKCKHSFSLDDLEKYVKWVDGGLTSETFSLDLLERFVEHLDEREVGECN